MRSTLGQDWWNFFDMAFCNAGKPQFFNNSERPMYILDREKDNLCGTQIKKPCDLKADSSTVYLEGNSNLLT